MIESSPYPNRTLWYPGKVEKLSIFLRKGARAFSKPFQGGYFVVISVPNLSHPESPRDEITFPELLTVRQGFTWVVFKPCNVGIIDKFLVLDYEKAHSEVVSIPLKFVEFMEFVKPRGMKSKRIVFEEEV